MYATNGICLMVLVSGLFVCHKLCRLNIYFILMMLIPMIDENTINLAEQGILMFQLHCQYVCAI